MEAFVIEAAGLPADIPAALDREASDFRSRFPADTHPGSDIGNLLDQGVRTAVELSRQWPGRCEVVIEGNVESDPASQVPTFLRIDVSSAVAVAAAALTPATTDGAGGVTPTTVGTGAPGETVVHEPVKPAEHPADPTAPSPQSSVPTTPVPATTSAGSSTSPAVPASPSEPSQPVSPLTPSPEAPGAPQPVSPLTPTLGGPATAPGSLGHGADPLTTSTAPPVEAPSQPTTPNAPAVPPVAVEVPGVPPAQTGPAFSGLAPDNEATEPAGAPDTDDDAHIPPV